MAWLQKVGAMGCELAAEPAGSLLKACKGQPPRTCQCEANRIDIVSLSRKRGGQGQGTQRVAMEVGFARGAVQLQDQAWCSSPGRAAVMPQGKPKLHLQAITSVPSASRERYNAAGVKAAVNSAILLPGLLQNLSGDTL